MVLSSRGGAGCRRPQASLPSPLPPLSDRHCARPAQHLRQGHVSCGLVARGWCGSGLRQAPAPPIGRPGVSALRSASRSPSAARSCLNYTAVPPSKVNSMACNDCMTPYKADKDCRNADGTNIPWNPVSPPTCRVGVMQASACGGARASMRAAIRRSPPPPLRLTSFVRRPRAAPVTGLHTSNLLEAALSARPSPTPPTPPHPLCARTRKACARTGIATGG